MKKPDLIKQLANRINQPHVIESWINKIEKAAYKKGYEDAKSEQCTIASVVGRSEQLQSFVSGFYQWHRKQNYVSVKREDWDEYIKTL